MHIGFGVNAPPTPFVCALVLLDGAAVSIYGTLLEIPIEDVRIGMRVEPVWVPDDELAPQRREHHALASDRRARRRPPRP